MLNSDSVSRKHEIGSDLERLAPGAVFINASLKQISRWRVGGTADILVRPKSLEQLCRIRAWLAIAGVRPLVIGATSNLLFADEGLRAVCIQLGNSLANVQIAGDMVRAESGVWVPTLVRTIMKAGLTGAEHMAGIPGTLGGLVCMNGGSQRKAVGLAVCEVTSVSRNGELIHREGDDCGFGYRQSVFQCNGEIIGEVVLRFEHSHDRAEVRREILSILRSRRAKFPQKQPNCGSVFKSNPTMYAEVGPPGSIIEKLGFKGIRSGGAVVSETHANFIVNDGGASAVDVLNLIKIIKAAVQKQTGYELESEVRYVRPSGEIVSADAAISEI